MRDIIARVKTHFKKHRVAYTAAITFSLCLAIQINAANSWNKFLDENELTDKFYEFE